jgi:hypothetical protein
VAIDVEMNDVQSTAFNRMAVRDYHKWVAMVVEGEDHNDAMIEVQKSMRQLFDR